MAEILSPYFLENAPSFEALERLIDLDLFICPLDIFEMMFLSRLKVKQALLIRVASTEGTGKKVIMCVHIPLLILLYMTMMDKPEPKLYKC